MALDPGGGYGGGQMDPRIALIMQAAMARQQGQDQNAQVADPAAGDLRAQFAAMMARQQGMDANSTPGKQADSPPLAGLGSPVGGPGPIFHGPPVHPPPWAGGGYDGGFLGPPIPRPDGFAAGQYHAKQQQPMDPQRALAMQEMGKFIQAYGKMHQQHHALHTAHQGIGQ